MSEWASNEKAGKWRRFRTTIAKRVDERDLDTIKRAAEVRLLEEAEGRSARDYSEAVARLIEASNNVDEVILEVKSVVLVKWTDDTGRSRVIAKVLSPTEMVQLAGRADFTSGNAQGVFRYLARPGLDPPDT